MSNSTRTVSENAFRMCKNFLTSVCREREEELSRVGGMGVRAKHSSSFIPALA